MTSTIGPRIDMPDAPAIPDLCFRFYAGEDDILAMAEVVQAANEANRETEFISADYLRSELANPSHLGPRQAILLAFVEERLVAYSSIEFSDTSSNDRYYRSVGHVHPTWRRQGIGAAMAAFNEARLRELAADHDHPGGRMLTTWIDDADVGATAIAQARGYRRVRIGHHMVRPDMEGVEVPSLAQGLEMRPITHDMLPRLWQGMVEAFRDHPGGQDGSQAAFRRWADDPIFELELLFVAFDGDEIAAGVQGWIDPEENAAQGYRRGWTDPVFTRCPWRRRGLAYALLGHALEVLRDRGMTSAQLGVDSENPHQALTLYERHRFEVVRSASEWHKPLELSDG